MQVVVDGLLTDYTKVGTGPAVLLVHGWGDTKETFSELIKNLKNHFELVAPDLPGFGKTQAPPEVWDLDDYALFLKHFAEKTSLGAVQALIAHSNGGAVCIRGLGQQTLQADKLVLLAASGIRNQQKGRRIGLKIIAKSGKVLTFWLPVSAKRRLRQKLYGVAGSDMLVAPQLQETFKRTVRQDVQADAGQITTPTLLLYGDQDTATPSLYGEIFHNLIVGSTLEIVGSAGHFIHQDQPATVSRLIKDFLQ